jgi:hypothetical protein
MSPFELALLAVAVPILALAVAEVTIRRTMAGLVVAGGLYAVLLVYDIPAISIGLNVTPNDVVYGLLLGAGGLRLLRTDTLSWQQRVLLVLFAVGVASIVRGASHFGVDSAVNEARKFIYFTGGALYVSTLVPRRHFLDRAAWLWLILATLLAAVGLLRMAGILGSGGEGFASQDRPLDSHQALIIAQGGFIGLAALREGGNRFAGLLAPIFLAMVVLTRHRTVWVVVLVGLVVYVATHLELARKALGLIVAGAVVTAVLLVTVFDAGETRTTEQLAQTATYVDTFDWRLEGWMSLLTDRRATEVDIVLGEPFGAGFERIVEGRLVDVSPHNWYIELYLRVGLLGLAAFLLLVSRAAMELRHDDGRGGLLPNRVLLVLLATHLVYFLAYDPRHVQGLMLGLFLCAMGSRARTEPRFLSEVGS